MLTQFIENVAHNMFKPLLLFFYAGFSIPILRVNLNFPKAIYQGMTIYLLLAIGWHGGEELASLPVSMYWQAAGFMLVGFLTNLIIGCIAYFVLRKCTSLRNVDAATVAGYYGSDSAGTFVTCLGVLTASQIAFAPYMPVMLAVMEIPGCLVALYIVSRLRRAGMDEIGNMPGEAGYLNARRVVKSHQEVEIATASRLRKIELTAGQEVEEIEEELAAVGASKMVEWKEQLVRGGSRSVGGISHQPRGASGGYSSEHEDEDEMLKEESLEGSDEIVLNPAARHGENTWALLHEVFLNPGIFLLFAGIAIGFISRIQGEKVILANDAVFVNLFQGILCLFLLEMGMTASKKLRDLKTAGWPFIAFGLLAPNVFAIFGMSVAHAYSMFTGQPLELGTYVLFAVLCGAASYIAVPAVQRLAIPEASPTLPLAASLGLTFSYNVTLGIPLYLMIAESIIKSFPVT